MSNPAQVVIVNGQAGAGKDTFCNFYDLYGFTMTYSSVDHIKEVAKMLGWNGKKDERSRKLLSDLKDIATEYNDLPMDLMRRFVNAQRENNDAIFLMIRERHKIERAKREFDAITLFVTRPDVAAITGNHADRDVGLVTYDEVIINDGTLDDLQKKADVFMYAIKVGAFKTPKSSDTYWTRAETSSYNTCDMKIELCESSHQPYESIFGKTTPYDPKNSPT